MKLEQLRKVIREEVKAAVKEELQEVLNEAVKVASTPSITENNNRYRPVQAKDIKNTLVSGNTKMNRTPLSEMINQTKATMTSEEYRNVYTGTTDMVQKPNFASSMASNMGMTENKGPMPGLDISQFDFVKKAGAVYNKAVEITKNKQPVG